MNKQINHIYILLFLTFFIISFRSFSTEVTWSNRLSGEDLVVNAVMQIEDGDYEDLTSGGIVDVRSFGYVRFGIEDHAELRLNTSAAFSVRVLITEYDLMGDYLSSHEEELTIDNIYLGVGQGLGQVNLRMEGVHKFDVEIRWKSENFPNQVYLEGGIYAERYYAFSMFAPTMVSANGIAYADESNVENTTTGIQQVTAQTHEIELVWNYIEGAEWYDVEWVWVDNFDINSINQIRAQGVIEMNENEFRHNSTRVRTANHNYRLPHVFERGYLIFRVRGVGVWLENVSKEKYGPWSTQGEQLTFVSDWSNVLTINDAHEADKNWQYQTTYAEGGKKKEVAQYFDGSLRGRQTVTRINSIGKAVIGESVYDNEGRAAVQILPVPVSSNRFRYYPSLNLDTVGNPYSHQGFDWEPLNTEVCSPLVAEPLSGTSGAGLYYSSSHGAETNWQQYVPDANGYAFTQVEYTPDNTGRIRRQSGVGLDHRIGGGHQTTYLYLKAEQNELNRLFGYKVGNSNHYKKNMVIDANGQVSVSYLDPQGRVIATALAGDNATDFESLEDEQNASLHQNIEIDLLSKANSTDNDTPVDANALQSTGRFGVLQDALVLNKQLGVAQDESQYVFNYTVESTGLTYEIECPEGETTVESLYFPYVYDLNLSLRDDCGTDFIGINEILGTGTFNDTQSLIDEEKNLTVSLSQGSYTLSKDIRVHEATYQQHLQAFLENSNCLLTTEDLYIDISEDCGEEMTCDECIELLGTKEAFLATAEEDFGPLTAEEYIVFENEYEARRKSCLFPCEESSMCDAILSMMLSDVSPFGQYGAVDPVDNMSVFNIDNDLPKVDTELSDYQSITNYVSLSGSTLTSDQITVDYITNNWNESWAEQLVVLHPEYPLYLFLEDVCTLTNPISGIDFSSTSFDSFVFELDTYAQALGDNSKEINVLNLIAHDPYFHINYLKQNVQFTSNPFISSSTTFNQMASNLMNEALLNYANSGLTCLEFSAQTILCGTSLSGQCPEAANYTWSTLAGESESIRDAIWNQYKNNYLGQKQKIIQLMMDFYGFNPDRNLYNGCMASGSYNAGGLLDFLQSNYASPLMYQFFIYEKTSILLGFNGTLSTTLCGANYANKTRRITRTTLNSNASGDAATDISSMQAQAEYAQWEQTGVCPLMEGMKNFIGALAVSDNLTTAGLSSNLVPQLTKRLFEEMGGVVGQTNGAVMIRSTITGNTLTLSIDDDVQTYCSFDLWIAGHSWLDYPTNWQIYEIGNTAPSAQEGVTQLMVKIGTSPENAIYRILNYTNSCNIDFDGCQAEMLASNEDSPSCTKKTRLEAELTNLFNERLNDNSFYAVNQPLIESSVYINSLMSDILNDDDLQATWSCQNHYVSIMVGDPDVDDDPSSIYITSSLSGNIIPQNIVQVLSTVITSGQLTFGTPINYITLRAIVYENDSYEIQDINLRTHTRLPLSCSCFDENEQDSGELFAQFLNQSLVNPSLPYEPTGYQAVNTYEWLNGNEQNAVNSTGNTSTTIYGSKVGFDFWSIGFEEPACAIHMDFSPMISGVTLSEILTLTFTSVNGDFSGTVLMSDGTVREMTGVAPCFFFVPDCNSCQPEPPVLVDCQQAYKEYFSIVNGKGWWSSFPEEVIIDQVTFCNNDYALIMNAYNHYLDHIASYYGYTPLTITEFGATPLGYSNTNLIYAVDRYREYLDGFGFNLDNPNNDFDPALTASPLTWSEFVTVEFMHQHNLCPPTSSPTITPTVNIEPEPCNMWENNVNLVNVQNQYDIYLNEQINAFRQAYVNGAMEALIENYTVEYLDKEYHYTLYYYDRAGNLVQTVPPKGVKRMDTQNSQEMSAINTKRVENPDAEDDGLAPEHTHQTSYQYNSLNQLVIQNTPDGGESRFAYDNLGRLVASQNAKQKLENRFSYTRYDALGRVIEVGEFAGNSEMTISAEGKLQRDGVDYTTFFPFFISVTRSEVTQTVYDELSYNNGTSLLINGVTAASQFENYSGDNTRNRITCVLYQPVYSSNLNEYESATFYDYDVHGNVKELLQVVNDPDLVALNQTLKHVHYSYDLVSGNVREVVYQKGAADEFHHKYHYDADNRITNVFTSADGIIYEQDAKYFYYDHGPLARVELGHEKVQAQDYAYTIQGWLKTVNGEQIDPQTMMGADGINSLNKQVARDVYGYSLNYFDGDYTSSNTSMLNHSVTAQTASMGQSLYNGNIRTMFTALSPTTLNQDNEVLNTHQTNYTYDQLNRIKSMTGYDRQVGQTATPSGYSSSYSYDPNGNLTDLQRWAKINDVSTQIDQLVYHYNDPVNGGNNNRLSYVTDDSGEVLPGVDLASQSADNYSYDAIGQLIQDNAEHIEEIKWTVTGKVKEIFYDAEYLNKHIEFMYNPMGNRIGKVVTINGEITKTFYTLDAQGNSMAIYTLRTLDSQKKLYLSERNIYGSSRLGMENVNYLIASSNAGNIEAYAPEKVVVGDKTFELSNHLGNVLNVVTDRKIPEFDATTGDLAFFNAEVVGYSDYYPFGMQMPGRNGSTGDYRYGFQGQESDDEVKGAGNSVNYKYRMHDPRIGRFFAVDPLAYKYPYYSPYAFSGNRVIDAVEEEGLQPRIVTVGRVQVSFRGHHKTTGNSPIGIRLTDNYKSLKNKTEQKPKDIEDNRPVCEKITSIYISENVRTLDNHRQPINTQGRDESRERVYSSENSIDININTYSIGDKIEIIDEKTGETLFIDEDAIDEIFYRTEPGQSVRVRITGTSGYEINVTTIERKKQETIRVVDDKKNTLKRERSESTPQGSETPGYERTVEPCSCEEE
jgi:RHS repeat-associated protein